jgi:hypothetical protein
MKKSSNNLRYTVWIDRRNAKILSIEPDGTKHYTELTAEHTKFERFKGETSDKTGLFGTTLSREKHDQQRENNYNQVFLKKVVSAITNLNALLILGSGDARFELQNAIEKNKLFKDIWIENKPCKKITQRELELETEKHFNFHLSA